MNKLPASLCEELGLTAECISKVNDYMEKAIKEAIERSKKITIKVKIAYENVKIERELVFDKNDKLEELFWKVNDLLEEEGCELYLGNELSYSYNGEEIFVQGDDIIKLPDGSLTTMYHYLKNSEKGIEEVLSTTKFEDVDA